MYKPLPALFGALLLLGSCSMPKTEKTVARMNDFWTYYKTDSYDSLRSFYDPATNGIKKDFQQFQDLLGSLQTQFGKVKEIQLIETTAAASTDGKRIELTYLVAHDSTILQHKFRLKDMGVEDYKIVDHNFQQVRLESTP